jgi:uncharacterized membrane protein YfcA
VKKVAATSIAIVCLTSIAAATFYVMNGWGRPGLPAGSVGFVDLPVGLALFVGTFVSVGWGVSLNKRLEARTLEMVFGTLFIGLGLRLIAANLL